MGRAALDEDLTTSWNNFGEPLDHRCVPRFSSKRILAMHAAPRGVREDIQFGGSTMKSSRIASRPGPCGGVHRSRFRARNRGSYH